MAVENDLEIAPDFEFALYVDFSVSAQSLKLLLSIDSLVLNFDALDRVLVTVIHRGEFPEPVLAALDRIPVLNLRTLPSDDEIDAVRNVDAALSALVFAKKAIAPFFVFLESGQSLKSPLALNELVTGRKAYARAHKQAVMAGDYQWLAVPGESKVPVPAIKEASILSSPVIFSKALAERAFVQLHARISGDAPLPSRKDDAAGVALVASIFSLVCQSELYDAYILGTSSVNLPAMISAGVQHTTDSGTQERLDYDYGIVTCRQESEEASELIVSEKPTMRLGRIEMPITAAGFWIDRLRCREDATKIEIAAYQSGQSSVVIWGPYKRLAAGRYSLIADLGTPSKRGLSLSRAKGTVSLDIYSNRIDVVLTAKTLSIRDLAASGSLEVVFDWTEECAAGEVEFRLHQSSSSKVYLFGYDLKRIGDAF